MRIFNGVNGKPGEGVVLPYGVGDLYEKAFYAFGQNAVLGSDFGIYLF